MPASDSGLAALQNDTNYLFLGVRGGGEAREIFLEQHTKVSAAPEMLVREPLPPIRARPTSVAPCSIGRSCPP